MPTVVIMSLQLNNFVVSNDEKLAYHRLAPFKYLLPPQSKKSGYGPALLMSIDFKYPSTQ